VRGEGGDLLAYSEAAGVDRSGKPVIQRKLRRAEVLKFFSKLQPSLIGIEACHRSH